MSPLKPGCYSWTMNTVAEFPNYYRRLEARFQLVNGQAGAVIQETPAPQLQAPSSLDEYSSQLPGLAREEHARYLQESMQRDANSILELARTGLEQLNTLDNSRFDRNPQAGLVVVPEVPAPKGWASKLVKVLDRKSPAERLESGDCRRNSGSPSAALFPQYARATMTFTTPSQFHLGKRASERYRVESTYASLEIGDNGQGVQQLLYSGRQGQILITPDLANGTLSVEEDSSRYSRAYLPNYPNFTTKRISPYCD